jgi:hypothetical protein
MLIQFEAHVPRVPIPRHPSFGAHDNLGICQNGKVRSIKFELTIVASCA